MKELKVDLFNSKKEKLETSIELSKFNIFIGNDLHNIRTIVKDSSLEDSIYGYVDFGSANCISEHKSLVYGFVKHHSNRNKIAVIHTESQFVLYAFNNLIFNYIVKDKMPANLRDEMTCKDIMIDPNDIRIYQVENGVVTRIQNKDGLIEHNCFDSEMNIIMNDFYKMIDYYE